MAEANRQPNAMPQKENFKIQTESIAFDPHQMTECGGCGRKNPPNRLDCFYCAHDLDVRPEDVDEIRTGTARLETWEAGFNLILHSAPFLSDAEIAKTARTCSLETAELQLILETKKPMPLARLRSEKKAQAIGDVLTRKGIECSVLRDESLMPDRSPVRLRGIEFRDDTIMLVEFNTSRRIDIMYSNLALIVSGIMTESKNDRLEKRRRRRNTKVLDEIETSSDQSVLDIYERADAVGYRIMLAGFDFSCLGERMGILAFENMGRLMESLGEFAPNARVVTDYGTVKQALSAVWAVDRRRDSQGLRRSGFAELEFGATTSSTNLRQLNKFSRLQWHLL